MSAIYRIYAILVLYIHGAIIVKYVFKRKFNKKFKKSDF